MLNPKISIITPSYNQGQYLEQTIESVLSQDYPHKELIIVDGGSKDNSVENIKKYEKHLAWWVSEPDHGQAHAINKGLHHATGQIFNWLNSDDYLEPGALSAVARGFKSNTDTKVVCGFTHCFFDESGETSHTYRMGLKKNTKATLLNIEMNQPGTFYLTPVVRDLGGINGSLRYVFDDDLWMHFLAKYGQKNVAKINDLLVHFRLHGDSKSVGEGFQRFMPERNAIIRDLIKTTGLPAYLQTLVDQEPYSENYQPIIWEINNIDISKLHAWFANKYMVTLFNQGLKKEARDSLLLP